MANNYLYIEDEATGDRLCVAKSLGPYWEWCKSAEEIQSWLEPSNPKGQWSPRDAEACLHGHTRLRLVDDNFDDNPRKPNGWETGILHLSEEQRQALLKGSWVIDGEGLNG